MSQELRQLFEGLIEESPFIQSCGMELVDLNVEAGSVDMKMPLLPNLARDKAATQFHGGAIASLIDTAGDLAVALSVGGAVPTINFRVDFIRPSSGPYLIAKAVARRVGRSVGVADVDVYDEQGRLTAIGRGCYSAQKG
ncbi:MAG: PaaI family thioesterase [Paenalcaligenes sp.]